MKLRLNQKNALKIFTILITILIISSIVIPPVLILIELLAQK